MEEDTEENHRELFKRNLNAYVYQLQLLLLFLWRGLQNCKQYELGTEVEDAEKYDDAVFFYEENGITMVRYVQAKYSRYDKALLNYDDFVSEWEKARCNLVKYFTSYRKIKQRTDIKTIDDLFLCTNISFSLNPILTKGSNKLTFIDVSNFKKDDIFYDSATSKPWKKFQLQDVSTCKEVEANLQACTNLNLMAKKLILSIFKKTAKGSTVDLKDYWISAYFNVLMEEKIIEFRQVFQFVSKNPNPKTPQQRQKNEEIAEFQNYYITEMKKQKNEELVIKELASITFDKSFIDKLNKGNGSNDLIKLAEILVKDKERSYDENFKPSLKFKIIKKFLKVEKEFGFNKNFIYGINIDEKAKNFRSLLFQNCEACIVEELEKHEFSIANASNILTQFSTTENETSEDTMKFVAKRIVDQILFDKDFDDIFKPENSFLNNIFQLIGIKKSKFSSDFVKNKDANHQEFRKIFMEIFFQEKLKNQQIKLKQDISEVSLLVDEMKMAYQNAQDAHQSILKLGNQQTIDGFMKALNGSVFVGSNQRNIVNFKVSFDPNQTCANKFVTEFQTSLKNQFTEAEVEDLKSYQIECSNYPPHFDSLEEKGDINEEIKAFCKKFYIVTSPNEKKIMHEVSTEMGQVFGLVNAETLTYDFFHEIMDWAKEYENRLLSKTDVTKIMDDIRKKISSVFQCGCTVQYCLKLKEYEISYTQSLKELLNFLLSQENGRILHLVTNETLLTAIKVAQTLKPTIYFKQKDRCIFNSLTSLLRMEYSIENGKQNNHISKAFSSTANLLLIVDNGTQPDFKQLCKNVSEVLGNNPNKKIVIIGTSGSLIASALINSQESIHYRTLTDTTCFNDLTTESKTLIMNKKKIEFQGNITSLNELIDENDPASELIDSQTLQKLVQDDEIIVGDPVKTFTEDEKDCYRTRKIRLIGVKSGILADTYFYKNHMFALEGAGSTAYLERRGVKISYLYDFTTSEPKSDTLVCFVLETPDTRKQFQKLCERFPNCFLHWLKCVDNALIWFYSNIPATENLPSEFFNYIIRKQHVDESFFYEYIKQNSIVVICDKAGMGKSTILTSFESKYKAKGVLKLRINLNQHTATLLELRKQIITKDQYSNEKFYLNFTEFKTKRNFGNLLLESLKNITATDDKKLNFEERIINYLFTKGKMLLIFDGYDEINPDYGDIVLFLLQKFKEKDKTQIWIASRTNFKETLEQKFNTIAYDLKPFDENDQKLFLINYWRRNYKLEKGKEISFQQLKNYVETLVKEVSQFMGDIIGIPLQTKMLAEVFQEDQSGNLPWLSCFSFVDSDFQSFIFPCNFNNVCMLYENYFNQKLFKYFLHAKEILDTTKPYATNELNNTIYFVEYPAHQIFGMFALDDKNAHVNLLVKKEEELKNAWLKGFNMGFKNIGIIDTFDENGRPLFNHLTYAEYLCACYLIEKLCNSPHHAKQVFVMVNDLFKKDIPVFVECFKYKLKQELENKELKTGLEDKSVLKFVAENGFLDCVHVFIHSEHFNYSLPIRSWKTVLNSAAEYGHIDIVIYIIMYVLPVTLATSIYGLSDFIQHLYNLIFIDGTFNIANSECKEFLNDFKIVAEKHLRLKEPKIVSQFVRCSNYKNLNICKVIKSELALFVLPHLLKLLSYESIMIILNAMKPFPTKRWIYFFIDGLCVRSDICDEKKLEIIELIVRNIEIGTSLVTDNLFSIIVRNDCINLVDLMIKNKKIDNNEDILLRSLRYSCTNGNLEMMKVILPCIEEDDQDANGWVPCAFSFSDLLHECKLEVIKYVLEETKTSVNERDLESGCTFDYIAGGTLNFKKIQYLIEEKKAIPLPEHEDEIPSFHWGYFDAEKKKKFYEYFSSLESETFDFKKAASAIMQNTWWTSKEKKYVNDKNETQWHIEAKRNDEYNFPLSGTIFHGIDDKNVDGNTPLHLAVQLNKKFSVQHLFKRGACYNLRNNNGDTPEAIATAKNNEPLRQIFKNIGEYFLAASSPLEYNHEFQKFNRESQNCFTNIRDETGKTILHHAILSNNIEAVVDLKKAKMLSLDEEDEEQKTPVYYAAELNNRKMLNLLLKGNTVNNLRIPQVENECTNFLSHLKNSWNFLYNEEYESLKREMMLIATKEWFNLALTVSTTTIRCIAEEAVKCVDLTLFLLQNGVIVQLLFKTIHQPTDNLKINNILLILIEGAECLISRKYEPDSIISYYNNHLTNVISQITVEPGVTDKIIANVRFKFKDFPSKGSTLLHLAAAVKDKKIMQWLIDEKGADCNAKDFNGYDIDYLEQNDFPLVINSFTEDNFPISRASSIIEYYRKTSLIMGWDD